MVALLTGWTGARHFLTIMLFLGMANAYVMRTNMSVAIVAMVNQTALPKDKEIVDDECGNLPANHTTVRLASIRHRNGMHWYQSMVRFDLIRNVFDQIRFDSHK